MYSAFGIDHGHISKAEDPGPPSRGRRATAAFGGGYHSLIAGKKGHKAKAYGNTLLRGGGGSIAGGAAGAGVGALASRNPKAAIIGAGLGSVGGGQAGAQRAVTVNQRRGHYKKEQ